jgi:hypothetical protein
VCGAPDVQHAPSSGDQDRPRIAVDGAGPLPDTPATVAAVSSERVVRIAGPQPSLTVYPQRGKQVVLGVGAAVFVVLGVVLLLSGGIVRPVIGGVAILVFGLFGVLWARQVASSRPALVVDTRGITDHASAIGAGFVPWSEITGLGTWSSNGQTIVTVGVADPAAVLARVGPLARIPMRANVRLCGSPVTLPTNALPFSADQLIREIAAFAPGGS